MRYLFDTSALLVHFLNEPGAGQLIELFDDPANECLLACITVAEFARKLREYGQSPADIEQRLDAYLPLYTALLPVDAAVARCCVQLAGQVPQRIPLVYALIASTAWVNRACLVHKDKHFAVIPSHLIQQINLAESIR
jgi:predicted nucleic acid-binding protein